ncbi:MAG: hypothetical protein G01um101416_721 [Microgenomates group bacterium Gr01-1014_16]|nr:MAG: hypothetical protein G01um101416_721 [Microgenomates group bacterium Gr01-1014_16]
MGAKTKIKAPWQVKAIFFVFSFLLVANIWDVLQRGLDFRGLLLNSIYFLILTLVFAGLWRGNKLSLVCFYVFLFFLGMRGIPGLIITTITIYLLLDKNVRNYYF